MKKHKFLHFNATPQSHFTQIRKICEGKGQGYPLKLLNLLQFTIPQYNFDWTAQLWLSHWSIFSLVFFLPWLNLHLPSEDLQWSVSHLWCGSVNYMFNVLNILNISNILNALYISNNSNVSYVDWMITSPVLEYL